MGVLPCFVGGCENIMCDYFSWENGYICTSCLRELFQSGLPASEESLKFFIETHKPSSEYDCFVEIPKDWKEIIIDRYRESNVEYIVKEMEKSCNDYNLEISDWPEKEEYVEFCEFQKEVLEKIYYEHPELKYFKPDSDSLPWETQGNIKWELEWVIESEERAERDFECLWVCAENYDLEIGYFPDGYQNGEISIESLEELLKQKDILERFYGD